MEGKLNLFCSGCVAAGNPSEDGDIGDRAGADAVVAMNAAGDFTRGEQTWHNVAFGIQNFSVFVDFNAAHRVVDRNDAFQNEPRAFLHRNHACGTAEFIGVVFDAFVVLIHRFHKVFSIDAVVFRYFFQRISFEEDAVFQAAGIFVGELFFQIQPVSDFLVVDRVD